MSQLLWQPSTSACTPWNLAQIPAATWQGWLHLEHMLMVFLLQALRPMSQALASQKGLTLMVLAIAERLGVNAEAEMTVSDVLPVLGTESPDSD